MAENTIPDELPGKVISRNLHFIWLIDWSYSMQGAKIQQVNYAIRQVIPELRKIDDTERVNIVMRAIRFGEKAEWHIGPDPIPVADFEWEDMEAEGGATSTAKAVNLLTEALNVEDIGSRNVPPVCILMSDGYCTEPEGNYKKAMDKLNSEPWGKKAVRLSIGIAKNEGDYNKEELDEFISPYLRKESKLETLHAENAHQLRTFIRIASTVASISSARSKEENDAEAHLLPVHVDKDVFNLQDELPDLSNIDYNEEF